MAPQGPAYGGLGPTLLAVSWMEFSLTTIIIAVRIYTKVNLVSRGGTWALFRAICAWAVGLFNAISLTIAAAFGMGNHENQLSNHDFSNALHWVWVGNATTLISISFGKIAVVAFLLTMQGQTYKTRRYMLYFLCTSTVLLNLTTVIIIFAQCDPPRKLWQPELPGNCKIEEVNGVMGYVCGAYGAFVDLALAVYPVLLIYKLQIGKRMKLGISTLMAAGVFSAVCATVKTVEVAHVVDSTDRTYDLTPLALWGATEMWMVIVACSVPACWPLAVHLFRKANSTNSGNTQRERKTSGSNDHRSFPRLGMGGTYHANAEGHRDGSREDCLLEQGIMMRTDLSVQREAYKEVATQGVTGKSSAEDDMRNAVSAAERV